MLGDAPILYTWFGQKPPFQMQLWDASRRSEQEVVVRALKKEDPEFVFWRYDFDQDAVPQYVRDPIIFRYVVDNYVPVRVTPMSVPSNHWTGISPASCSRFRRT